jgi:hypothetical protein
MFRNSVNQYGSSFSDYHFDASDLSVNNCVTAGTEHVTSGEFHGATRRRLPRNEPSQPSETYLLAESPFAT